MGDEIKEIKEILEELENMFEISELNEQVNNINKIKDYITNLEDTLIDKQECIDVYNEIINNRDKEITNLQQELIKFQEFKEEHKIMKQILIENGLWERLLNDDRFLKYLRNDDNE